MISLTVNPRTVDEADFPAAGTAEEKWLFLLNYALLAPSEYNTQPWLFRVKNETVVLYRDASRSLPIVDPDRREMLISCGAACVNLRLAARHFGYLNWMECAALSEQPDALLRLSLGERRRPTEEDEQLFAAIPRRHTNRSVYEERPVSENILEQLEQQAGKEGVWLQFVQDAETHQEITRLIITGDREQWASKQFREELAAWVHSSSVQRSEGLPASAQAKGSIGQFTSPFVVRTFDLWREEASRDRQLTAGAPLLVILGTFTDTPADWFATGLALERLLLNACASGLQTSFVNQPIEIPALRVQLKHLLAQKGYPQLVLRMGYGEPHITTQRRCVQDVLLHSD